MFKIRNIYCDFAIWGYENIIIGMITNLMVICKLILYEDKKNVYYNL